MKSPLPRKISSKIKRPQAFPRLRRQLHGRARLVLTNGCFDILHRGHVDYLDRARRLGTHLVVALNSDASVRAIKGPSRPLNNLEARLSVLAALECVDFVTWFDEETPEKIIRLVHPDVYVKGGDWSVDKMLGADLVLEWGGKVKSLSFVDGFSTTSLIARMKSGS